MNFRQRTADAGIGLQLRSQILRCPNGKPMTREMMMKEAGLSHQLAILERLGMVLFVLFFSTGKCLDMCSLIITPDEFQHVSTVLICHEAGMIPGLQDLWIGGIFSSGNDEDRTTLCVSLRVERIIFMTFPHTVLLCGF